MDLDLDPDALDLDDAEDLAALYAAGPEKDRRRRGGKGYRLFNVIPKTAFDYTFLAVSTNTTVVLQRSVPLTAHYYYWFGLRLHAKNISVGDFTVSFWDTLPSAEDPREFTATSAYDSNLSVVVADTVPSLKMSTRNAKGPYTKVTILCTQGTGTPPLRLYCEISIVLLARPI